MRGTELTRTDRWSLLAARGVAAMASWLVIMEGGHPVWVFNAAVWSAFTVSSIVGVIGDWRR